LSKSSITLESGNIPFSAGSTNITPPEGIFTLTRFPNVKADDLTPDLTISITAVNGIPAAKLNATGYMKIDSGNVGEQVRRLAEERTANMMVRINGGTFTMGSPVSEPNSSGEVQHSVTVSSFYMGKHEVTQREWREVMGNNPSYFKGDDLPVEQVSWYEVVEYCNKRSQREGLTLAYTINGTNIMWNRNVHQADPQLAGYRLPTEAEWEYACRAGTTTPYSTGNNITTSQANYNGNYPYNGNTKGTYQEKTTSVGSFAPNVWGLYDMHGNVYEWCWDWYGDYAQGTQTDPAGAGSGSHRVDRGGSWVSYAQDLRSAYRGSGAPASRYGNVGFRLVRSAE
jgi:formylglycine-generating enzyme required for sulfatase activity